MTRSRLAPRSWPGPARQKAREFWATLSGRARWLLGAGVFFSFAPIGLLLDVMGGGQLSPTGLSVAVVASGLLGVGYAWAALHDLRWLPVTLVAHLALAAGFDTLSPAGAPLTGQALASRLQVDAVGTLVCLSAAYGFYVSFIGLEGERHLRSLAEIRLARDIHRHLVPEIALAHGAFEVHGRSTPSGDVGGDLVDFVPREDGGWTAGVFDVSGHGVASGVLMAVVKSAFRTLLSRPDPLPLARVLTGLDTVVRDLARPGMFVTAVLLQADAQGRLTTARAGHLPALVVRADTGAIEPHGDVQPALGLPLPASFTETGIESRPGDLWVLVSDGLTEVFDRDGQEYGLEALVETIAAHRAAPLTDILAVVTERVEAHGRRTDDQSLLFVRHHRPLGPSHVDPAPAGAG